MSFKISVSNSYWHKVEVVLFNENGEVEKSTFQAKFKRLTRPEVEDSLGRGPSKKAKTDAELIDEVLLDWKDVEDPDGKAIPFNKENRDKLFQIHEVQPAVAKAFYKSIFGEREKN
ncbi:hypothetical protein [Limnobacter sp.]|uniref:hypothetical protein n=1 Tax=Limnobacter sp. TaxID=2003368 RepID=UPI0025C02A3E|nr:hypothetical protein [Limnobacter sp.]